MARPRRRRGLSDQTPLPLQCLLLRLQLCLLLRLLLCLLLRLLQKQLRRAGAAVESNQAVA